MKFYNLLILYRNKLVYPYVRILLNIVLWIAYLFSAALIGAVIYEHGFHVSASELQVLNTFYHVTWLVMLTNVLSHLFLGLKDMRMHFNIMTWVLTFLLLLTLIPVFFHRPLEEDVGVLKFWELMGSKGYRLTIMIIMSVFNLSTGVIRLLGRRTNPSLILAGSFIVIILIGSVLLKLPRCTFEGISWFDSLFVSTSAVCVTGLTPLVLTDTFTDTGFAILLILIQVGGLGVMTFTSFFALFFMGNTSIYNQVMVRDMVNSNSLESLLSTLFTILMFTLSIEAMGMVMIWTDVHGTLGMDFEEELGFCVFHAVSSFCNSGMSNLPDGVANPLLVSGHIPLYIYLSVLTILGGLGFPILVNLWQSLSFHIKSLWCFVRTRRWSVRRSYHLYNLNTRIVLIFTVILLVFGTAAFAFFEWNGVFAAMTVPDKLVQSFFMAVCPRSVGFTATDVESWTLPSLMVFGVLMWIGGGAQSTAGGIKVNTFAVILFNAWALLRGADRVEVFGRELSSDSLRRANVTALMSLSTLFVFIIALSLLEPELPFRQLFYECMAAITTSGVGLSVTPHLGNASKLLITALMFIGRVGLITVLLGIIRPKKKTKYRYPKGEIIIN